MGNICGLGLCGDQPSTVDERIGAMAYVLSSKSAELSSLKRQSDSTLPTSEDLQLLICPSSNGFSTRF